MQLSQQVSLARKERGVTQEELADRSGLTVRTIQRIESGETQPRAFTLKAIAMALDISFESFGQPAEPQPQDAGAVLHFMQLFVLSCFAYLVIPFVHFLVPSGLLRKRQLPAPAMVFARKLLRLQVGWLIAMNLCFLLVLAWNLLFVRQHPSWRVSYLVPFFAFYFFNAVVLIYSFFTLPRLVMKTDTTDAPLKG